jgi:hypothetical protein
MHTNRARLFIAAAALAVLAFFVFAPPITLRNPPDVERGFESPVRRATGILGLWQLRASFDRVLFTGVLLTFFGSSYYHLAPSDSRLVWDGLPMTLVFMALLACVVSGEKDSRSTRWLLVLLLTCCIASVLWWSLTNDPRLYVLVQFGPLLILVPALWFVRDARYLSAVLGFYALAKAAEFWDRAMPAEAALR